MKTHSLSSKRRGFTLVELLVVIAIIAALAGLAITGVQSGLKAADAAKATRNMKEIYGALSSLQTEGVNTGLHAPNTFPPYKGSLQDGQKASFVWWDLVAETLDLANRDQGRFRWTTPPSETLLQNPLSKKVLGEGQTTYDSLYNDPDISHGSFAFNAELGGDVSSTAQEENAYTVRLSRVEDPPTTIYFGEADDDQKTAGWVFKNMKNAPQGNHKDSAHCCFIDGHIEFIKNTHLKEKQSYDYFTQIKDKNYSNKP
ncbi:MAG: prepilin-type N-terminal cleavage/methylation domain-containing protein [Akkermansiaceae bacterium]|nr:prepilin-type N-terminal cleavage/methylation domain-containing protein [Akkermansiaceae bacterium]